MSNGENTDFRTKPNKKMKMIIYKLKKNVLYGLHNVLIYNTEKRCLTTRYLQFKNLTYY